MSKNPVYKLKAPEVHDSAVLNKFRTPARQVEVVIVYSPIADVHLESSAARATKILNQVLNGLKAREVRVLSRVTFTE